MRVVSRACVCLVGVRLACQVCTQGADRQFVGKAAPRRRRFEVNFGIIMSSAQADRRVTQLMEIPVRGITFPEGVDLPVGETRGAIGVQISTSRQMSFAMRHEERSRCWVSTRCQILVQEGPDGTREEHFAGALALMKKKRAFGPGNVVDVDEEGFLTAQAPIIDQPEGSAIAPVLNRAQHRLDLLHVQGPSSPFPLWFPLKRERRARREKVGEILIVGRCGQHMVVVIHMRTS